MTAPEGRILARITADVFWARPEHERVETRAWLRANGIDPNITIATAGTCVEVVLLDAPFIHRREYHLDDAGRPQINRATNEVLARPAVSLLRVPLPPHLADPQEPTP